MAYVGFEVIADDAEEAQNPSVVIPRGILISLTLVMLINMAVVFVTLGTVPWQDWRGRRQRLPTPSSTPANLGRALLSWRHCRNADHDQQFDAQRYPWSVHAGP